MIDRIFKSWKSTVLGLALLTIGAVALFTGKATLGEFSGFVVACVMAVLYKEKK